MLEVFLIELSSIIYRVSQTIRTDNTQNSTIFTGNLYGNFTGKITGNLSYLIHLI